MSTAHFRVTYDGPALDTHTMDVRHLSPALLAMADLCEEAGRVMYGEGLRARVDVRASFRTGSFGIDLSLASQLAQQIMGWLAGPQAAAIANGTAILSAIGVTGGGLIAALRWLKGRKIHRVEPTPDGRRLFLEDGESLVVEEHTVLLLQSRIVRTSLQRVIEPIEHEGIDRIAFGDDQHIAVVIERTEATSFVVPPPQDIIFRSEERAIPFSIVSLSFREDNKWRLSDGQATVFVTMSDPAFLDRVARNIERFSKGDILLARTAVTYWQTPDGLRTDYTVLEVIEHKAGMAQIPLSL